MDPDSENNHIHTIAVKIIKQDDCYGILVGIVKVDDEYDVNTTLFHNQGY